MKTKTKSVILALILIFIFTYCLVVVRQRKTVSEPLVEDLFKNIRKDNSKEELQFRLLNEVHQSLAEVDASLQSALPGQQTKVKAVLLALTRNSDEEGMSRTINQIEASFNRKYQYPYLFLNDVPFTDKFKAKMRSLSNASMEFGLIPREHWSVPDWIDKTKFEASRKALHDKKIPYGGSESYRHMCRFNSGFFYKHPLIQKYDFYWRVFSHEVMH
jgi:hypothetical protein